MATESLNVVRDSAAREAPSEGGGGFTRRVDTQRRIGRANLHPGGRSRLFDYDRTAGVARAELRAEVEKTDRMSVEEARRRLNELHDMYGVAREEENLLYDFDHALFLCYAINGSSQAAPTERVRFYVHVARQGASAFDYDLVRKHLGVDFRRFFRAFANEVVDACHHAYHNCDFSDPTQVELRDLMIQLADDRNISRFPWLIADSCDAATNISATQRAAVMRSKQTVISNSNNVVDRRNVAVPIRSADNYDSSLNESVPLKNDIHAAAPVAYYS